MHATPGFAEERALKMNAQNLCAGLLGFVLPSDVIGVSGDALASLLGACRYGGGHNGSRAVSSDRRGHCMHGVFARFHYIVPSSTVDVYIHEAWHCRLVPCGDFRCAIGQLHVRAWANRLNHAFAN